MKRILSLLLCVLLLTACGDDDAYDAIALLRQKLQSSTSCAFTAYIAADYGEYLHEFEMDCVIHEDGEMTFLVTEPETIAGITGTVSGNGGRLTFDDKVLAVPLLCDDQITPVSAPWIFWKALCGGYIHGYSKIDSGTKLIINDSFQGEPLQADIWLDEACVPTDVEILYNGRRILSLTIKKFTCA